MAPNLGSTSVLPMPRISFKSAPHPPSAPIPSSSSATPSSTTQPGTNTTPTDPASCFNGAWLTPPHTSASSPVSLPSSHTPGFYNAGNTCFLNAALQCILHQPPVINLLLSDIRHRNAVTPPLRFCAYCCLQTLARAVHASQSPKALSAMPFARYTRLISPTFRPNRQEDAHEFIRGLLDAMVRAEVFGCATADPARWQLEARSDVHRLFGGALQSSVVCSECRHASVTSEPFLDLSLEVAGANSIDNALHNFTTAEILKGENRYRCDACKKLVVATKRLTIRRAPNVLTLHLKRFNRSQKDSRFIEFPEVLNLGKFMLGKPQSTQAYFRLTAVLVHLGVSRASGHYVAYVKTATGSWVLKDDSTSRSIPSSAVLRQRAYVLLYSRTTDADLAVRPLRNHSTMGKSPTNSTPVRSSPVKTTQSNVSITKPSSSNFPPQKDLPSNLSPIPAAARGLRGVSTSITPPKSPVTRRALGPTERSSARKAAALTSNLSSLNAAQATCISSDPTPALVTSHPSDSEMLELSSESEDEIRSPSAKRTRANIDSKTGNICGKLAPCPSVNDSRTDSRTASAIKRGAPILPGMDEKVDDLPPVPRKPREQEKDKCPTKIGGADAHSSPMQLKSNIESSVSKQVSSTPAPILSGKGEANSAVPTPRRNVLIGGSGSARKAIYRVFGVTHENTKSERKRPFLDSGSEMANQTSAESVAPLTTNAEKLDLTFHGSKSPKAKSVCRDDSADQNDQDLSPNEKDVRKPSCNAMTKPKTSDTGSSDVFGSEGVDRWDSSLPPQSSTPSIENDMHDSSKQKIVKRRRAGDDLDAEYDRGRQRRVRLRASTDSSRNAFDSVFERRHGATHSLK